MTSQPDHGRRRPRVALIFGGRSSEHGVSLATAAGVLRAIDRDAYEVLPIGITRTGEWVLAGEEVQGYALRPGHQPEVLPSAAEVLVPMGGRGGLAVVEPGQVPRDLGRVDVVFPLLHGPYGEDGTLQGLLEMADLRYVGSGVTASAVMMDKHVMKLVLAGQGLPVSPYTVITDRGWRRDSAAALDAAGSLAFPVFVKPARAGSSMGITRVADPSGLREAIEVAREHDPKVLVEAGIPGRELECGVLQGRDISPPRISELGEIVVTQGHDFYDYDAKYLATDDVRLDCPAAVPDTIREQVRHLAARAFEAADCEGLARVDFFYTPQGRVLVNEVNTMPGFTPMSMFPRMWSASGIDYTQLITELIELALQRPLGLR